MHEGPAGEIPATSSKRTPARCPPGGPERRAPGGRPCTSPARPPQRRSPRQPRRAGRGRAAAALTSRCQARTAPLRTRGPATPRASGGAGHDEDEEVEASPCRWPGPRPGQGPAHVAVLRSEEGPQRVAHRPDDTSRGAARPRRDHQAGLGRRRGGARRDGSGETDQGQGEGGGGLPAPRVGPDYRPGRRRRTRAGGTRHHEREERTRRDSQRVVGRRDGGTLTRRGVGGVALPAGAGVLTALTAWGRAGEGDAGAARAGAAPERIRRSTFRGGAENGRSREMQIERFQDRPPAPGRPPDADARLPQAVHPGGRAAWGTSTPGTPPTGSSSRPSGGASCARSTSTSSGTSSTWASSTSSSSRSSGRTAGCTACRAGAGRGRTG